MSSHVDSEVNTKFLAWTKRMYGKHGEVKSTRGNEHDFLGMLMKFNRNGRVTVDMSKLSLIHI